MAVDFHFHRDPRTDERIYTLRINGFDFAESPAHRLDKLLLEDCSRPDARVSDLLLGLQMIVFRIEQEMERQALES